nr:hemolysin family protein [Pseudoclavibacter chungangensis]
MPITALLIVLSAFFVAVEFALLAAKRHRLEEAAATSRAARAALRSSAELTVLLAGSQLGITACTLALGAITKPAVHHWLLLPLEAMGVPTVPADVVSFVLALFVVTFLHLVVGEMAPKSWAIANPESSATLLAVPMRIFMWFTRPLLLALNKAANWCLRLVGVTPRNEVATGQTTDDLRHLVEHSANVGALDVRFTAQLKGALQLERLTVADLVPAGSVPVQVSASATVADVQRASRESTHLRILVHDGERISGIVHVRDTLVLPDDAPLDTVVRPVLALAPDVPVYEATATMRASRAQLAIVGTPEAPVGVVTVDDVLNRILVDPAAAATS